MQIKRLQAWKEQLKKSKDSTNICKVCFKDLEIDSLHSLFVEQYVCSRCFIEFEPFLKEFKIDNIDALALYPYNSKIRELIFRYKGCRDYELKDVFISPFLDELKTLYKGYKLAIVPSFKTKVEERGFDHVEEIFSSLGLEILHPIIKTKDEKQANKNFKERQKIIENFKLIDKEGVKNEKILIVDDVCTTGASLKAMVKLLKELNPRKIKILVVAKREFTKEEKEKMEDSSFVLD